RKLRQQHREQQDIFYAHRARRAIFTRLILIGRGRRGLCLYGIAVFFCAAIALVDPFVAGGWRVLVLVVVIVLQAGVEAVRLDEAGVLIQAKGFVGEGQAEEILPDRARDMASVRGPAFELDEAVVATHPTAGEQLWGITHEPGVGVVVRGTGLAAHFGQT